MSVQGATSSARSPTMFTTDTMTISTPHGRRSAAIFASGVAALSFAVSGLTACGSDDVPQQADTADSVPESTVTPRVAPALGIVNATYEYTIPDGAGAAMAAGARRLDILPGSLTAKVGESIRIENNDRQGHSVGPWYVGPNETLIQQFTSPGVFEGECTVHDSGRFILEVVEA